MSNVIELLKNRILEAIRSVSTGWKVVVVDAESNRIVLSACKIYDILEEKVTYFETIDKPRQAYPQFDAVYILTPTYAVVTKVIEDFAKGSTPIYAAGHLFFTSPLDEKQAQRLYASPAGRYVKIHSLHIDYQALEARVFTLDTPYSFFRLYSPEENAGFDDELRKISTKVTSMCISLGENPVIRYQRSLESDHPTKSLSHKLAMLVQSELDQHARHYPDFANEAYGYQRGTLLLCDRSLDMNVPFLHEFTYQAMANDILPIEDGKKYNYDYTETDGTPATKEAILDDEDKIWVDVRHKHMKDCIEKLMTDFNEFVGENAGFTDKEKAASLNDMKKMLANLPQFQTMKEKFSIHLNIAQECMSMFEKYKLANIASIEQNCATGCTPDGHYPKAMMEELIPLLDDPAVSTTDRVRMIILYVMFKNGILDEDRLKLLTHAQITREENDAINNTAQFGVRLIRSPLGGDKSKKSKQKQAGSELQYDISRYAPQVKTVLENIINDRLDHTAFPFTKDLSGEPDGGKAAQPAAPQSLRSNRARWFEKPSASETKGSRIIIFIAGGMAYSEMRTVYEMSTKRDIIIGSTHVITPTKFIEDLKLLRKPPRPNQGPPLPMRPTPNAYASSPAPVYGGTPSHSSVHYGQEHGPVSGSAYHPQYQSERPPLPSRPQHSYGQAPLSSSSSGKPSSSGKKLGKSLFGKF